MLIRWSLSQCWCLISGLSDTVDANAVVFLTVLMLKVALVSLKRDCSLIFFFWISSTCNPGSYPLVVSNIASKSLRYSSRKLFSEVGVSQSHSLTDCAKFHVFFFLNKFERSLRTPECFVITGYSPHVISSLFACSNSATRRKFRPIDRNGELLPPATLYRQIWNYSVRVDCLCYKFSSTKINKYPLR
jgi:hypothetical protein